MTTNKTFRIFVMAQQCACGPDSSCCTPSGLLDEEIGKIISAVEKEVGCRFEVVDITNEKDMNNHGQVMKLVHTFGQMALPIITLDDEVLSVGNHTPEQAVSAVRAKMSEL